MRQKINYFPALNAVRPTCAHCRQLETFHFPKHSVNNLEMRALIRCDTFSNVTQLQLAFPLALYIILGEMFVHLHEQFVTVSRGKAIMIIAV